MTQEEFIKWLDDEIELMSKFENPDKTDHTFEPEKTATIRVLKSVKNKFLTLMPPPTTPN